MIRKIHLLWLCPPLILAASRAFCSTSQEEDAAGLSLYHQGLYTQAMASFQKAVSEDPNDWQAYEHLGDAYLSLNYPRDASNAFRNSLMIHPDNPTVSLLVSRLKYPEPPAPSQKASLSSPQAWPTSTPSAAARTAALNPLCLSKMWFRFETGYANCQMADWLSGAGAINQQVTDKGYRGGATADPSGMNLGFEMGFLLGPNWGLGLGIRFLNLSDFRSNVNYQPGGTPNPDYEDMTLSPHAVPLTFDGYFFLPDGDGRFFLGGGLGLYQGSVHVTENYSFTNSGGGTASFAGTLNSDSIGFQAALGREWAILPGLGLSLLARGRLARLSHFQGQVINVDGSTATFGLETNADGTVDVDNVANIGNGNERFTSVDFSGFDVLFAVTLYGD